MISHKIVSKFFITGILVFLLLNTTSLGLYQNESGSSRQEPIPHIFGQMGENQWYISAVTISFDYDPAKVLEIHYNLSGTWYIYSNPFNVVDDDVYIIPWIWIEMSGRPHDGLPIDFKIDKTPPTIEISKKSSGKNKLVFTAVASDEVSKIEKVEFYLDDVLNITDNEEPYEYTWTGEEKQIVYAICYNYAGFIVKSDNLTTTPRSRFRDHYFMQRFFILMQELFCIFY